MSNQINKRLNKFKQKIISIRSNFPEIKIPEFDEKKDLEELKKIYEPYIIHQKVTLESSKYKIYLIGFFFLLEFISKKFNIDSSGFLNYQLKNIKEYERIIYQFIEKKIRKERRRKKKGKKKENVSLEKEFASILLKNILLFFIIKFFGKYIGQDTSEQIINMLSDNKNNNLSNILSGFDITKFLTNFTTKKEENNNDEIFLE